MNRMTYVCENITFPASLRSAVGNKTIYGPVKVECFSYRVLMVGLDCKIANVVTDSETIFWHHVELPFAID